jgi:hypothetical protein
MEEKQNRVLKAIYGRTGGKFGSPFNPLLFQPGSGFAEKEFTNILTTLISQGYIQKLGENGPDVMLTQKALDWIAGEFNGENQRKIIEFLKALDAESGGNEIKLDDYVLKLGEHIGLKNDETVGLIKSLHGKGYIRLTGSGSNSFISASQIGRELIKGDTTGAPFNIFISHIHENEAVANKLKEFFISLFGEKIEVFISGDPKNIHAGQDFFTTIIDGIKRCDCMIILCSPDSVKRYYIYFEAGAAAILGRTIIPLCFGGQSPGALPTPLDHIRAQAIDSDDTAKLQQHFKILVKDIANKIGVDNPVANILETEFYQVLQQANSVPKRGHIRATGRKIDPAS